MLPSRKMAVLEKLAGKADTAAAMAAFFRGGGKVKKLAPGAKTKGAWTAQPSTPIAHGSVQEGRIINPTTSGSGGKWPEWRKKSLKAQLSKKGR